MNAPGKTLLKISGILMIIGAAVSLILAIISLTGGGLAVAADPTDEAMIAGGAALMSLGIIALIGGVFQLIVGIVGVKNSNKPEKYKVCMILGIIVVAFGLVSLFTGDIVSGLIGLIIPALYLWGAFKNKAAA